MREMHQRVATDEHFVEPDVLGYAGPPHPPKSPRIPALPNTAASVQKLTPTASVVRPAFFMRFKHPR
jgi:hypothetical protein